MTEKEYRSDPAISRSQLWKIKQSPMHFRYAMDNPESTDSPALAFGRAAHKYVLQPESFNDEFAVFPVLDRRTKEGKAAYAKFMDDATGKETISAEDFETIKAMREALEQNPLALALLTGTYEEPFFWTDEMTGEACKCRTDCRSVYNGDKYIVDYKTVNSCADGEFERDCRKYGYKFQSGMYTEGVTQNDLDLWHFAFVAQEKKPPYASRVYFCSDEFVAEGYDQFRQFIGIYHDCKQTGDWYGYDGKFHQADLLMGEGETE